MAASPPLRLSSEAPVALMIGEIGGPQEVAAARWAKENLSKPLIGSVQPYLPRKPAA